MPPQTLTRSKPNVGTHRVRWNASSQTFTPNKARRKNAFYRLFLSDTIIWTVGGWGRGTLCNAPRFVGPGAGIVPGFGKVPSYGKATLRPLFLSVLGANLHFGNADTAFGLNQFEQLFRSHDASPIQKIGGFFVGVRMLIQ